MLAKRAEKFWIWGGDQWLDGGDYGFSSWGIGLHGGGRGFDPSLRVNLTQSQRYAECPLWITTSDPVHAKIFEWLRKHRNLKMTWNNNIVIILRVFLGNCQNQYELGLVFSFYWDREILISCFKKLHNHSVIIHLWRLQRCIIAEISKIHWKSMIKKLQYCFANISATKARIFMKF